MSSADELLQRFVDSTPRFERARDQALEILKEVLASGGIDAALTGRIKDLDSFRGKLELRTDYTDPWAQITDKIGARAIVHRADAVDEIHRLIVDDGRLRIYGVTDKRTLHGEKELGYSGLHLDVYVPRETGETDDVPVELQIRTIAQHAWSEVSHKLLYKPQVELDETDRRAIWRLVALVEVFDGEVGRVLDNMPGPALAPVAADTATDLVSLVAANYALFESNLGQRELTWRSMSAVAAALERDRVDDYPAVLRNWVGQNTAALRSLFDDYGPRSDMAVVSDYLMWAQPESVALLECLEARPSTLLAAWQDHELPERWLRPLAAHTGAQIEI